MIYASEAWALPLCELQKCQAFYASLHLGRRAVRLPAVGEDRRRVAKIVAAAVATLAGCLMILGFSYVLGRSGGYYDAQADGYSAQIGKAADSQIEGCFRQSDATVPTARECVEQVVRSSREDKRDEQDLSAQRQMAKWAFWLLLVTASQMPLTALGLYFLLQTIWQGREALALQKREARPWLSFRNLSVRYLHIQKVGEDCGWLIQAVLEVEIINSGGMPAGEVRALAHAIDNPISKEAPVEVERLVKGQNLTGRGLPLGILPPNGVAEFKAAATPYALPATDGMGASLRDVFPGILLSVIYRAIGDDTIHQTAQVFRLSYGDPAQHTDNHGATGFWLAHKSYEPRAITVTAGSKMDRAT